ncbi:hypothetical protein BY996DRAFT_6408405 [Phakopsora pachyrhizi]|nr:hypothetical protein BY996DRAFT_6408405 [Phakopsora pachyrhizi]
MLALTMTGALQDSLDFAEYRKAELVEDGRFNFCANEPWAGLMTKLVIERVQLNDDDESDGTAVQSVYSTILGNKIDKTTTGSKRNCAIPEADSSCSSPENRPTKIRKKFMGKSILSSSKDSSKESDKTLSSSDLSSSIAAKLKITKCGKGKSSSSELSQPEDKNLKSKAKADSYIT